MTQAHKTPGALVEFKEPDPLDADGCAVFGEYIGKVFEVVSEVFPGHYSIKDIQTNKIVGGMLEGVMIPAGFHPEDWRTISKERELSIRSQLNASNASAVPRSSGLPLAPDSEAPRSFVFRRNKKGR